MVLSTTNMIKTKVSYDIVIFRREHQCRLLRREAWSSFEVSVGITEEGEVVTYLRFITNFSNIFKPITYLTKRNQKYEWGAEREEAFQTLKNDLCVKDKILATSSETPKVENAPAEMLRDMDQQMEKRANDGKANMVTDALSKKERVKPRRVRAMAMTIQYGVRGMIPVPLVGSEMDEAHASSYTRRFQDVKLARIYIDEIVARNGVPCTAYHLQMDGQSERAIRTLEGMLRAYEVDYSSRWGVHLPLAELSYNNSYHSSIQYALFEAFYAGNRRKLLDFKVGDHVLLKVSPWKSVVRFLKKGKLAPRYVGPFEILERIGPVAYRLRLPEELSGVHDTFHVSNLKKCLADASLHVPLDEIKVDKTFRFVKEPVENSDREVKRFVLVFVEAAKQSGADKSFISISLASMLNIPPITLDTTYDIEIVDGNLVGTNTVIQGCTMILLNQPFEIDLMPIKLDSFDVVIGMDWLSKYHARIICDKKVVHIPFDGETLIIRVKEFTLTPPRLKQLRIGHLLLYLQKITRSISGEKTKSPAFQLLKQKLYEAPILALPEGNDDFVIYYDASLQFGRGDVNAKRKNYDCEMCYPLGKAKFVSRCLKPKNESKHSELALVLNLHLKLPSQIPKSQTEAIKEDNIKVENLRGMNKAFEIRPDGTRCIKMKLVTTLWWFEGLDHA
ncbi:putative reverse transcriptase domain-containing protein [Tanacetum coccineum]